MDSDHDGQQALEAKGPDREWFAGNIFSIFPGGLQDKLVPDIQEQQQKVPPAFGGADVAVTSCNIQ